MVYPGRVNNGLDTLGEPTSLPEGAEVLVDVISAQKKSIAETDVPTLFGQFKNLIGKAQGLPPDMAENHDRHFEQAGFRALLK